MAVFFASSYVKLQDAFAAETGAVGSHAKIGYVIPASSNFTYSDPNTFTADNTTNLGVLTEAVVHWEADNSAKLNDCAMHSKWQVAVKAATNSNQGVVDYVAGVKGESAGTAATTSGVCLTLTPNFAKLSTITGDLK